MSRNAKAKAKDSKAGSRRSSAARIELDAVDQVVPGELPRPSKPIPRVTRRRSDAFTEIPERLPDATEFSDDPDLGDPVWLLKHIGNHPDIVADLEKATDLNKHAGRRRVPGKWWMIMLAFVCSGEVDVQTFRKRWRNSPVWQLAGFPSVPSPTTCWERLIELEPQHEAFTAAANKLIRRAVKHEPRISRWVWTDGTGFETNARLEYVGAETKLTAPPPRFLKHAGNELIKAERHAESKDAPDETAAPPGAVPEVKPRGHEDTTSPKRLRPYRYFAFGKPGKRTVYRTLDPDAGVRTYARSGSTGKRTWLGGNCNAAVSMFVGAPLAIDALCPANVPEDQRWPGLLENVVEATGTVPEAVVMDRHFSTKKTFKFNTELGVTSVIPWRKWRPDIKREDTDTDAYDRHGVVRCRGCGGPCDQTGPGLGLYFARGKPRLRVRCMLGLESDCKKIQSIACEEEWRLLVPLSRLTETYHALANTGKNYERVFRHWRERYSVAGNDVDTRPKRPGLAWQHLRASVALLIEWYFLSLRHGWIGSHRRRNQAEPQPMSPGANLRRVLGSRRKHGLDLPIGKHAVAAGYGGGGGPPPDPSDDAIPF